MTKHIISYAKDGFAKVCDVRHAFTQKGNRAWKYVNVDKALMYSPHKSWIYFVVDDTEVVKIGESGNPLGVKMVFEDQPAMSSICRLGRLRGCGGTDEFIRTELRSQVSKSKVSIWAKKCEIAKTKILLEGTAAEVSTTIHKTLEIMYIENFVKSVGALPRLNKAHK